MTLQVITNAECARTFGNVVASTLCVSGAGGSTCAGDSGGPLAIGSGATRTLVSATHYYNYLFSYLFHTIIDKNTC